MGECATDEFKVIPGPIVLGLKLQGGSVQLKTMTGRYLLYPSPEIEKKRPTHLKCVAVCDAQRYVCYFPVATRKRRRGASQCSPMILRCRVLEVMGSCLGLTTCTAVCTLRLPPGVFQYTGCVWTSPSTMKRSFATGVSGSMTVLTPGGC
eukprot:5127284-Amphidinium_carterae.1